MQEKTPRLKDYLDVIIKQRKWIISAALISTLAAGALSFFLPDVYEANAMLYIREPVIKTELLPESIAIVGSGQVLQSGFGTKQGDMEVSLRVWQEILKGQEILKEIIGKLKLDKMTVEGLGKLLEVERLEEKRSYNAVRYAPALNLLARVKGDPGLAADIVNTWGGLFVRKFNEFYLSQLEEIHAFMLKESETSKERLEKAERDLLQFKSSLKEGARPLKIQLEEISLNRDLEDAGSSYELFRQKAEEARLMLKERAPQAVFVSKAVKPGESITPNITLSLGLAGLAGFLVSIFLVIGLAAFQKK